MYQNQYPNPNCSTAAFVKNTAGKVTRIISIVFLILSIILLSVAGMLFEKYMNYRNIEENGKITEAYIVSVDGSVPVTVTVNGETTVYYNAIVEYTVDDRVYKAEVSVDEDTLEDGGSISVIYDIDNPSECVAEDDSHAGLIIVTGLLGGIGCIFLLVGGALLVVSIVIRKKQRQNTFMYNNSGMFNGNTTQNNYPSGFQNQNYNAPVNSGQSYKNTNSNPTPWEK